MTTMNPEPRPPLPPFDKESATTKVRMAALMIYLSVKANGNSIGPWDDARMTTRAFPSLGYRGSFQ